MCHLEDIFTVLEKILEVFKCKIFEVGAIFTLFVFTINLSTEITIVDAESAFNCISLSDVCAFID